MTKKYHRKLLIFLAFASAAATYFLLPPSCPEAARRTFSIFVLAAFFWALEIIPLYATSFGVILLLIFTLAKPDGVLQLGASGYQAFITPFANPVIVLFLGGFVLSAVLHKHRADEILVGKLLRIFGKNPYVILLGFIFTTGFFSMWMSNTATTALMLAMIRPVLDKLDSNDRFKEALVLAVAFSANIGGIGTPIGSPPNAIAVGLLAESGIRVSFTSWVLMAAPLAIGLLLVLSIILFLMFRPNYKTLSIADKKTYRFSPEALRAVVIGGFAILLWLTSEWHRIPESVVALLMVGCFAVTGLMNRDDINRVQWDILILMWGGLALGKAVELSGLGEWVIGMPMFSTEGIKLVAAFALLAAGMSAFISNTATASFLVPIVLSVSGANITVLAAVIAIAGSFDMVLPVSTPPNAMAFATSAVSARSMFKAGASISLISLALLIFGYPIMTMILR